MLSRASFRRGSFEIVLTSGSFVVSTFELQVERPGARVSVLSQWQSVATLEFSCHPGTVEHWKQWNHFWWTRVPEYPGTR
eukprot:1488015-Rhodomonas_salina.1